MKKQAKPPKPIDTSKCTVVWLPWEPERARAMKAAMEKFIRENPKTT